MSGGKLSPLLNQRIKHGHKRKQLKGQQYRYTPVLYGQHPLHSHSPQLGIVSQSPPAPQMKKVTGEKMALVNRSLLIAGLY
ncbi:hypothetical protein D3C75_822200 [compost metagenome]